jgi:hypothetical protein
MRNDSLGRGCNRVMVVSLCTRRYYLLRDVCRSECTIKATQYRSVAEGTDCQHQRNT